ncbi:MAG: diacylglycerol/lipid kinase family protein [Phycisphaerae bacterium]
MGQPVGMDGCLIINPKAGDGEMPAGLPETLEELWGHRRIESGPPEKLARALGPQLEAGVELFVAAGGDGTVNAVLNALLNLDAPPSTTLAVVPLGTGNDLAAALNCQAEPDCVRNMATHGRRRAWDVGLFTSHGRRHYFANAATGGFSGQVQQKLSTENRAWGPLAYFKSAVEALQEPDTFDISLVLDGRAEAFNCVMLALMLGRTIGGGVPAGDETQMNDGLFDVFAVRLDRDSQWADIAGGAVRWLTSEPSPEWNGPLLRRTARTVVLKSDPPMPLSLDGEKFDCTEAAFEILPARLHVLQSP